MGNAARSKTGALLRKDHYCNPEQALTELDKLTAKRDKVPLLKMWFGRKESEEEKELRNILSIPPC